MAERFERLYSLPNDLYSAGSPVIVSAGVLLKDNQTGSIVAQLKYQSISSVEIKALRIDIIAYDVSGNKIDGVKNYQYLDLAVKNGQEFGSNKAVILPNKTAKSFSIGKLTAVLADNSIFDISLPLVELPKLKTLQDTLWKTELVKQYKLAINDKAEYVPCESSDLWTCSCGNWSREERCVHCWALKQDVFSAYNLDVLSQNANERLAFEKVSKEKESKRRRGQNRKIIIVSSVIAIAIAIVLAFNYWLYPDVIVPSNNYKEAEKLFDEGKYSDAAVAFRSLGEYKDSMNRVNESLTAMKDEVYEYGIQLMQEAKYEEAIEQFESIPNHKDVADKINESHICIIDSMYNDANTLLLDGQYEESIKEFNEVINYWGEPQDYKGALAKIDEAETRILTNQYNDSERLFESGKYFESAIAFAALGNFRDAKARSFEIWGLVTQRDTITATSNVSIAIKNDGTVVATGANWDGAKNVSEWKDIVAVSAGRNFSVGLRKNGTVVVASRDKDEYRYVNLWEDIVAISAGYNHVVGLKSDGTVVAVGENWQDQCEVDDWKNIIAISAGEYHTVGLKSDGTVVSTELNPYGEGYFGQSEVSTWKDIVQICTTDTDTIGLRADGTVIAVGMWYDNEAIPEWTGIVAISAQDQQIIGLKADGTVVRTGRTVYDYGSYDMSGWRNIVAIFTSSEHTLGLKENGTVIAIGNTEQGQCDVSGWSDIMMPIKITTRDTGFRVIEPFEGGSDTVTKSSSGTRYTGGGSFYRG